MKPELPYLGAGVLSLLGGAVRENGWPSRAGVSVIGTVVLVIGASATANTKLAPLVHAIGLLLFFTALIATVNTVTKAKKGK